MTDTEVPLSASQLKALRKEAVYDCWVCTLPSPYCATEWHHIYPQQIGGVHNRLSREDEPGTPLEDPTTNVIPLCKRCHDMVDRIKFSAWFGWAWLESGKEPAPFWAKLTILKQWKILGDFMGLEKHRREMTRDEYDLSG